MLYVWSRLETQTVGDTDSDRPGSSTCIISLTSETANDIIGVFLYFNKPWGDNALVHESRLGSPLWNSFFIGFKMVSSSLIPNRGSSTLVSANGSLAVAKASETCRKPSAFWTLLPQSMTPKSCGKAKNKNCTKIFRLESTWERTWSAVHRLDLKW